MWTRWMPNYTIKLPGPLILSRQRLTLELTRVHLPKYNTAAFGKMQRQLAVTFISGTVACW